MARRNVRYIGRRGVKKYRGGSQGVQGRQRVGGVKGSLTRANLRKRSAIYKRDSA